MNVFDRVVQGVDRLQQRFLAYPAAIVIKFTDDQAGNLAALMTYYAFVSVFPLVLVLTTVLGYVLQSDPALADRLLHSALADFPVIGTQLKQTGLVGHWYTLVIGLAISVWGAQGVARSVQTALNTLWNVPFVERPAIGPTMLRSMGLLGVISVSLVATGLLSGVGSLSSSLGIVLRVLAFAGSLAINVCAFLLGFRLATARSVRTRDFALGAAIAAVVWQGLLTVVSLLVAHEVEHQQELYGTFGLVLGLLAWMHLQSVLTLFAVEADVVRVRRLWPRSAVPPPLTRADRQVKFADTDPAPAAQAQPVAPEEPETVPPAGRG